VHLGLAIAERAYVLSHGNLVLAAPAADLRDDLSLVQASYLGEADLTPTTEGLDR
jgi:ABC-type branched-subunit amino acid transport system ATPase component